MKTVSKRDVPALAKLKGMECRYVHLLVSDVTVVLVMEQVINAS